jgi:hypothetical protein
MAVDQHFVPRTRQAPVQIMVDCSYDSLMSEEERQSLCRQLQWCVRECARFAKGRQSANTVEVRFVGVSANLRRLAERLKLAAQAWPCCEGPIDKAVENLGNTAQVLMLSPDAVEPITSIPHGTVCIIAGFVDKPTRPGVSLSAIDTARKEKGWLARRLPIQEYSGLPPLLFSRSPAVKVPGDEDGWLMTRDGEGVQMSRAGVPREGSGEVEEETEEATFAGYASRRHAADSAQVLSPSPSFLRDTLGHLTRHQLRLDCCTIRLLGLGRRGWGFGCAPSVYACVPLAQTSLSLLQQVLSINAVLVCLLEFVSTQVLHALSHTGT